MIIMSPFNEVRAQWVRESSVTAARRVRSSVHGHSECAKFVTLATASIAQLQSTAMLFVKRAAISSAQRSSIVFFRQKRALCDCVALLK
jgi:lipopolysaccharide/colanic/teichoic acid biosynthesis glycosyltransferase